MEERIENILDTLINKRQHILLHGPGGTGKTMLLINLAKRLEALNKRTFSTAPTGIAAVSLLNGSTLHRWAGCGIKENDYGYSLAQVKKYRKTIDRYKNTRYLIIDEISMLSLEFFERLDRLTKEIRQSKEVYGGIKLILSGDFLQLPSVNSKYIFEGELFKSIFFSDQPKGKIYIFDKPYRFNDPRYFEMLQRVRIAEPNEEDLQLLEERLKAIPNDESGIKPTVLFSTNADVNLYNQTELDKLEGNSYIFQAIDGVVEKPRSGTVYKEYYEELFNNAIPKMIELRKGAQVMLRYNLDVTAKLCNGSRGIITEIIKKSEIRNPEEAARYGYFNDSLLNSDGILVRVKFLTCEIWVPHTLWKHEDDQCIATRSQIPLTLAWSSTINKTQGLTLDYVTADVGSSIFLNGAVYVALSRVRGFDSLFLSDFNPARITASKESLEIVRIMEEQAQK